MTARSHDALKTALKQLAMDAAEQEAYLSRLGVLPSTDELALELDDARLGITLDDVEATSLLERLDAHLEKMSGEEHAGLWTVDALRTAPEWIEVRRLAAQVLRALTP
jgi:hypothetical protein